MSPEAGRTWVVGAGGLLGSSVTARLRAQGRTVWQPAVPVAWGRASTRTRLAQDARSFVGAGGPWRIAWCAGAAVTAATPEDLAVEADYLRTVLEAVDDAGRGREGTLFLASSAGGVYAGSTGPPHDERTVPQPLSPYGEAKLAMEAMVADAGAATGMATFVGRISNLYGPGQNLRKPQGLIPQLIRSLLLRQPTSIYVSTDTLRDHLFAPDCARTVVTGLDLLERERAGGAGDLARVKVLASRHAVTIGHLVAELGRIARVRPLVTYGVSPLSRFQVRDLRLASVTWPELDRTPPTPLPVGMRRTFDALSVALQAGRLS